MQGEGQPDGPAGAPIPQQQPEPPAVEKQAAAAAAQKPPAKAKNERAKGSNHPTYAVGLQKGDCGFDMQKESLMITQVNAESLKKQRIPEGAIIRQVDGVDVYTYEQFERQTVGKPNYALGCVLPGPKRGIFKIRPRFKKHTIEVHPETLAVVRTDIKNWPSEQQVVVAVNGISVQSYEDYYRLVYYDDGRMKDKFFVTVVPMGQQWLPERTVTWAIDQACAQPENFDERAVKHLLDRIRSSRSALEMEFQRRKAAETAPIARRGR